MYSNKNVFNCCLKFLRVPVLKFRNYNPHTEELKNKKLPRTKPESGMIPLIAGATLCVCG